MKYVDGTEVKLGDKVRLGVDADGVVVCSLDTNEYSEEYSEDKWKDHLKKGVLILFPKYGLIHYEEPEEDLQLLSRNNEHS